MGCCNQIKGHREIFSCSYNSIEEMAILWYNIENVVKEVNLCR